MKSKIEKITPRGGKLNALGHEFIKLKNPRDWTAAELKEAMKLRERSTNSGEKKLMMDREREWFQHVYGDQPLQYDETGKMLQPRPVNPVRTQPVPIKTKDGEDVDQAVEDMFAKLRKSTGGCFPEVIRPMPKDGLIEELGSIQSQKPEDDVVRALQSGVNILSQKQNLSPLPDAVKMQKLKEDGFFGPKTSFGLKKALVDHGKGKVSEAIALGGFKETVKKAKRGQLENLGEELTRSFAPILPKQKTPKPSFQPEGLALQDTLNDLGASLKDDGVVGPKTTEAFNVIARSADEDDLVSRYAQNMGFDIF